MKTQILDLVDGIGLALHEIGAVGSLIGYASKGLDGEECERIGALIGRLTRESEQHLDTHFKLLQEGWQ